MKKISLLLVVALLSMIALVGCTTTASKIKVGADTMLKITSELTKEIDTGNKEKLKGLGEDLESNWSVFEDEVKQKYPDIYEKVEDALDPTIAGTRANPLDKDTLMHFISDLNQALIELSKKVK